MYGLRLAFVDKFCVVDPSAVGYRKELYDEYVNFCESTNLGKMNQPNFNSEMGKQHGITLADESVTRRAIFKGVKLKK